MNHTNVVDVKAWIDTRPVSRFQWNVLLLCFIIIMLDGYDAAVMGFVAPALIEDWGISRAEMGPILGAAMFGVAIGALVAGPLSDRRTARRPRWAEKSSDYVHRGFRRLQPADRLCYQP